MLLKKRLDYGFGGYLQSPAIPRGPRSVRRRRSRKMSGEDSQICAFELLAAVAGKLLQESESSSASSNADGRGHFDIDRDDVKCEQFGEDEGLRLKVIDQGSCIESLDTRVDSVLDQTSVVTNSDISKDLNLDLKLEICTSNSTDRDLSDEVKGTSNDERLFDGKIINGDDCKKFSGDLSAANPGCINDPAKNRVNKNVLINSGSSVQLYRNRVPSASFAKHRNNVKLGIVRDDDERSFRCNSAKVKAYRPQTRLGYRRIRKILTSKYWKVAPKLKDSEFSYSHNGMKPFYCSRKRLGPRERWLCDAPSKRRKLSERSFMVPFDQEASSERSPLGKGVQKSRSSNVKLSIKSFKVPELYIEVPETATVGALKRTVMEAVSAILRDGLRVGVVLQGKKVRDDNRTLQQAGLSERSNLDDLGFTLEAGLNQVSPITPKKPSALVLPDDEPTLLRSTITPKEPPVVQLEKLVEEKVELSIPAEAFSCPRVEHSKDLVPIVSPIPINQKSKRSELLSNRRTRRPFSVGEVEALVEAVETLGTGRWRDVKIRAFDNADHRTYVDLKDKWKTLVHTASISPQQRRGEPVPQELLDRVLCAHAYWSQHQARQNGKHNVESLF